MKTRNLLGSLLVLLLLIPSEAKSQVNVGDEAPNFTYSDTEGNSFSLSSHRGKVVFMFFFGNTCPSCLAVGGSTESNIYQNFKDNSDFVAVGLDMWNSSSTVASVSSFKSQTGITYPLLVKAGDQAAAYGTTYDRLLVVDRDGILRHKGSTNAVNDLNAAIATIQAYLEPAGINDNIRENLPVAYVYFNPNTAKQVLAVNNAAGGLSNLQVFDITGRRLLERQIFLSPDKNEIELDPSRLQNGLHIFRIDTGNGALSGRFMVQK